MTTNTCPACSQAVPVGTANCPACGLQIVSGGSSKRVWLIVALVLAVPAGICVIGMAATLLVPNVMQKFVAKAEEKARADLMQIANALDEYAIRNNARYPDDLVVLCTPDENGYKYLQATKVPRDPWKNEYVYRPPAEGQSEFTLFSKGPDGIEGGADDIDLDD